MRKTFVLVFISSLVLCGVFAQTDDDICKNSCPAGCFFNSGREKCTFCPSGCMNCTTNSACTQCYPGYLLNDKQGCVSCGVVGCGNCSAPNKCNQCLPGWFLSAEDKCEQCDPLCDECASATECKTCQIGTGYGVFLSTNKSCKVCSVGCLACNDENTCVKCAFGFALQNGQCQACNQTRCIECNADVAVCTKCDTGSFLQNGKCVPCSDGCVSCKSWDTCDKCADAHWLNENGGCTRCMADCQSCKDGNTCDTCMVGGKFDSDKGVCVSCPSDCPFMMIA